MDTCCHSGKQNKPVTLYKYTAWPLIALVKVYRLTISPIMGPHCRFEPSCSSYAEQALSIHGPIKGTYYTLKRIARCHPWGGCGYDPVPEKPRNKKR